MAYGSVQFYFFAATLWFTRVTDVSAQCREGWYYQDGHCYGFGESPVTWGDAQRLCNVFSGKLAEVETLLEGRFLTTMAQSKKLDRLWLGGTDILDEGNWVWVTSKEVIYSYTNWHPGQPNSQHGEDCLSMYGAYQYEWEDYPCDRPARFICEADPKDLIVG